MSQHCFRCSTHVRSFIPIIKAIELGTIITSSLLDEKPEHRIVELGAQVTWPAGSLTSDPFLKLYVAFIDDFSESELFDYVDFILLDQTKERKLVSFVYFSFS